MPEKKQSMPNSPSWGVFLLYCYHAENRLLPGRCENWSNAAITGMGSGSFPSPTNARCGKKGRCHAGLDGQKTVFSAGFPISAHRNTGNGWKRNREPASSTASAVMSKTNAAIPIAVPAVIPKNQGTGVNPNEKENSEYRSAGLCAAEQPACGYVCGRSAAGMQPCL